jgi:3-deoxy-D-manno-octulosonate 8-phosphate phosphatase (KDO 8-P phosphatase)
MTEISPTELQERLAKVKLLALDVDGTLTDGSLYYSDSGEELKKFNVKDGQGLKTLMQAGVEVAIISASSSTSILHRAKKLGVTHIFIGIEDKLAVLRSLCELLGISLSQIAYAGDDVNDLTAMQAVDCPFTVANGSLDNKKCAIYITQRFGGDGAVREICDLLVRSQKAAFS